MSDHYPECWRYHPACALVRIRELEFEVQAWEHAHTTASGGQLTHQALIPMHLGTAPTWARCSDEPPVR